MEPKSANTILEEAERTRTKILEIEGFVVPQEIAHIFEEYSKFFEDYTFDEWRFQKRYEELIEYVLWKYEYEDGEEGWRQLLINFWPEEHLEKRRRLLRGLFAGRSEKFWTAVERQKDRPDEIGTRMAVAIRKGQVLNIVLEMLASIKDPEGTDKAYKEQVYQLLDEILNEEKRPLPKPKKEKIDDKTFWNLIATADASSATSAEFCSDLGAELLEFSASEINQFRKKLTQFFEELAHYDIWAAGYILMGGCSDDSFDYFRMWIISQGQDLFNLALTDLEAFVSQAHSLGNQECEGLLSVPENCYFQRAGKKAKPIKVGRKIAGSPWTSEELTERFQKLIEIVSD